LLHDPAVEQVLQIEADALQHWYPEPGTGVEVGTGVFVAVGFGVAEGTGVVPFGTHTQQ